VVEERYEAELAQSTQVLDDVDRALERLSDGTYHSCEVCGATIADVDLNADPTRRVCDLHVESGSGSSAAAPSSAAAAAPWTPAPPAD
jgi:hypothetical protein